MDNVNHPAHYQGKHECIDEMIAMFGVEAVKAFCKCNVYKYRFRAAKKNGKEDLNKADWYMDKLMELNGENTKNNNYQNNPKDTTSDKTTALRDTEIESLWTQFTDIPMNPDTERIDVPFFKWQAGTKKEDIWHWFDKHHSKGICYLLYTFDPNNRKET